MAEPQWIVKGSYLPKESEYVEQRLLLQASYPKHPRRRVLFLLAALFYFGTGLYLLLFSDLPGVGMLLSNALMLTGVLLLLYDDGIRPILQRRAARLEFQKSPQLRDSHAILLSETFVQVGTDRRQAQVQIQSLPRALRSDNLFVLAADDGYVVSIPRRILSMEQADQLDDLFRDLCGPRYRDLRQTNTPGRETR